MQNGEDYADELEQLSYCLFDSLWCYLVDIHEFIPQNMQNDEDYAAFVLFVWFTMMLLGPSLIWQVSIDQNNFSN